MKAYYLRHIKITIMVICLLFSEFQGFSAAYADAPYALNNGYLRFGTGVETSVNSAGNLLQPFYYYGSDSAWYKLTYSSYALNNAIGVGGDGTEQWNVNGTILVDQNLTSQNLNTSSFADGWGTIVSTGNLEIDGKLIEVQNTYMLPEDKAFIKILTKVTNKSAVSLENVRYWAGTQDDYLDGSDAPTKERGNIESGLFTAISEANQRAGAIKIYNARTCAFFFSTSTKANTSIYNTYSSFGSVISQNPATSPILSTGDQSYSMYVRMNDLAPDASEEFIWYYAAGEVGDLSGIFESISDDVAAEGQPKVSLSASKSSMSEEPDTITITATLSELVEEDVTVNLGYTGTADLGTDYSATDALTITAGGLTAAIDITSVQDLIAEGDETVIVDITSVSNAAENGTQRATLAIADDDEGVVVTSLTSAAFISGGTGTVYTAAATYLGTDTMAWSISGSDAALFAIDGSNGILTFVNPPDFASPLDADQNNVYELTLEASDGTFSDSIQLSVTVNEKPSSRKKTPKTPLDQGSFNGQTVKDLEGQNEKIQVQSGEVIYSLSASQINIDKVSEELGGNLALEDIHVNIRISNLREEEIRVIQDTADENNYSLVVPPVEFEITCESGGQTVSVSRFNSYVERTIAIPDGIDPSKITTGVIINADGTFSHVPTTILFIDGKYYARINSLTNSTYSVIYNPATFVDLGGYWAEDIINNMGARLIVSGTGDNKYEPELDITRAEFAAMTVRALGLLPGQKPSRFLDVASEEWYSGYIQTACDYGLITGYEVDEFGPNDKIIREDAMVIIARAMGVIGMETELSKDEVDALLARFKDVKEAFEYIRNSMAACLKENVITGRYEDAIEPKDYITRAEVAVILNRMLRRSELI